MPDERIRVEWKLVSFAWDEEQGLYVHLIKGDCGEEGFVDLETTIGPDSPWSPNTGPVERVCHLRER